MRRHPLRGAAPAAALALLGALAACDDPPLARAHFAVDTTRPAAEVDERFLSFAVDTAQLVGGTFWDPAGAGVGTTGDHDIPPYDFSQSRLARLVAELAPAYLRLGGSDADRTAYDLSGAPADVPPAGHRWVLDREMWDGAMTFARAHDLRVIFTLNAGPGARDAAGRWLPEHARPLIAHAAVRGDPVDVWELGNELNAFPLLHGTAVPVAQYAADLAALRRLVRELAPGARVAGPASAFWPLLGEIVAFLPGLAALGGAELVDVVTWHYYPTQSMRCPVAVRRAGPRVLLEAATLDEIDRWAEHVEAHAGATPVWLGESGSAQCGGERGVSDTFAASFWFVDQLGRMARRGQRVVVRQTLSGSDYGLIDDDTLDPRPDYWAALLWRRLVGTRALGVAREAAHSSLRVYAACARGLPGAVTVIVVATAARDRFTVETGLPGPLEVYALEATDLTARQVRLNGAPLAAADDGRVPPLRPQRAGQLDVGPESITFAVFPEAGAAACRR